MIMQYNLDMKTKPVTVTIPENVILEVKKMADDQGRSFSNMVTVLLAEAAKNKAA
jgi:predicted DNA binding CopG/RHH family protein